jgi:hypothetical protein
VLAAIDQMIAASTSIVQLQLLDRQIRSLAVGQYRQSGLHILAGLGQTSSPKRRIFGSPR